MADELRQSRSPVHAITSIHHPGKGASRRDAPGDSTSPGRARLAARQATSTTPGDHRLSCPECGTSLRLELQPAPPSHARRPARASGLHAAPEPDSLPDFEATVKDYKRKLISRAMKENDGVMTRAAEALGLKYTTFVAMAHRLDVVENNGDDDPDC